MNKIVVVGLSGESVFLNIDHFNKPGETVLAKSKFTEPGGKGYNQALALGMINADVSFITVLGSDPYKDECLKVLKENNVKVYPVFKDVSSSYAVIETDNKGENNVCLYKGASDLLTFEDILVYLDVIKSADILLIQLEFKKEVVENIIKLAHDNNVKVILNPAPFVKLSNNVLSLVDIITLNYFEASQLFNTSNVEEGMMESTIPNIIVTNGSKELLIKTDGKLEKIKVKKVNAVDTTGAGDIFNSFFTYYCSFYNIYKSAKLASIASTISVTRQGVVNAIPKLSEVSIDD